MLKVSLHKPFTRAKARKAQSKRRFVTFHDLPIITGIMALAIVFIYPSLEGSRTRFRQMPTYDTGPSSFQVIDLFVSSDPNYKQDPLALETSYDPSQATLDNILMDIQVERAERGERVARTFSQGKRCKKRSERDTASSADPNDESAK